jgi:hypothetical protein
VIEHGCRRILHDNIPGRTTRNGCLSNLREAFPEVGSYRSIATPSSMPPGSTSEERGMKPIRTSGKVPGQNGIAERWIGRCCRELLDTSLS